MLASRVRVCAAAVAGQAPTRGNWLAQAGPNAAFIALEHHVMLCRYAVASDRTPLSAAGKPFVNRNRLPMRIRNMRHGTN